LGNGERTARLTSVRVLQFYFNCQEMVSAASRMPPMQVEKCKLTVYVVKVDVKLINPQVVEN